MLTLLQSDPIDAIAPEKRIRELLNEWLGFYFTGCEHRLPAGRGQGSEVRSQRSVIFPRCKIGFGQTYPQTELPLIHLIFAGQTSGHCPAPGDFISVSNQLTLTINVRVPTAGLGGNQADHLAGNIADLVRLLIETPAARAPLAAKGLLHFRAPRPPVQQTFPSYQNRLIVAMGTLRYELAAA